MTVQRQEDEPVWTYTDHQRGGRIEVQRPQIGGVTLRVTSQTGVGQIWLSTSLVDVLVYALLTFDGVRGPTTKRDAALARVRELHQPVTGHQGFVDGDYREIDPACSACGTDEDAEPWPCPTFRATEVSP